MITLATIKNSNTNTATEHSKKAIKKRDIAEESAADSPAEPLVKLQKIPRTLNIYAVIQSETRALFLNRDSPTEDHFYKILESYKQQHLDFLGEHIDNYHLPYDATGFIFKKTSLCSNPKLKGDTDLLLSHVGKKALFRLKVIHYSSKTGDEIAYAGLMIRVLGITLI
jgi:hypothetical protein